jgi:hypothetical protein
VTARSTAIIDRCSVEQVKLGQIGC